MRHEFDAALKADPDRLALAERAAAALDTELAFSPEIPAEVARWRLPGPTTPPADPDAYDPRLWGAALVEFEVVDDIGSVAVDWLREWEAAHPRNLGYRVRRAWSEVLGVRIRRHLREWIDSLDVPEPVAT